MVALDFLRRTFTRPEMPTMPVPRSMKELGSGVVLAVTSARSDIGGSPPGVLTARKERTSVALVGVKVRLSCCQPVKPMLTLLRTGVSRVWLPRLTSNCSVVAAVKLVPCCWAPAK